MNKIVKFLVIGSFLITNSAYSMDYALRIPLEFNRKDDRSGDRILECMTYREIRKTIVSLVEKKDSASLKEVIDKLVLINTNSKSRVASKLIIKAIDELLKINKNLAINLLKEAFDLEGVYLDKKEVENRLSNSFKSDMLYAGISPFSERRWFYKKEVEKHIYLLTSDKEISESRARKLIEQGKAFLVKTKNEGYKLALISDFYKVADASLLRKMALRDLPGKGDSQKEETLPELLKINKNLAINLLKEAFDLEGVYLDKKEVENRLSNSFKSDMLYAGISPFSERRWFYKKEVEKHIYLLTSDKEISESRARKLIEQGKAFLVKTKNEGYKLALISDLNKLQGSRFRKQIEVLSLAAAILSGSASLPATESPYAEIRGNSLGPDMPLNNPASISLNIGNFPTSNSLDIEKALGRKIRSVGAAALDDENLILSDTEFNRILSILVNTTEWGQQHLNASFYISGISDDMGRIFLKRYKELRKIPDDQIVYGPLRELIEEAKKDPNAFNKRIKNKTVFMWGYYPFNKECGHTKKDVLDVFGSLRTNFVGRDPGRPPPLHIVISKKEFDYSDFSDEERRAGGFPLKNYPKFLHLTGNEMKSYMPRSDLFQKKNFKDDDEGTLLGEQGYRTLNSANLRPIMGFSLAKKRDVTKRIEATEIKTVAHDFINKLSDFVKFGTSDNPKLLEEFNLHSQLKEDRTILFKTKDMTLFLKIQTAHLVMSEVRNKFFEIHKMCYDKNIVMNQVVLICQKIEKLLSLNDEELMLHLVWTSRGVNEALGNISHDEKLEKIEDLDAITRKTREFLKIFKYEIMKEPLFNIVTLCHENPEEVLKAWYGKTEMKDYKKERGLALMVEEILINRMEKVKLKSIANSIVKGYYEVVTNSKFKDVYKTGIMTEIMGNVKLPSLISLVVDSYSASDGRGLQVLDKTIDLLERYKNYIEIFIEQENPFLVYQTAELEKIGGYKFGNNNPSEDFQNLIKRPGFREDFSSALKSYAQIMESNLIELRMLREKAKELIFTGMPLLKREFSKYIENGEPIKILDAGSGYNQPFLYRLKKVMEENNIKADIYGVEPNVTEENIKRAKNSGMTLIPGYLEYRKGDVSKKHKYHIIFINAPDFIRDVKEFLEVLDYLLSEDGIIIFRSGEGERHSFESHFKKTLDKKYSDKWKTERIEIGMRDLPEGDFSLAAPLLIKRVSPRTALKQIVKPSLRRQL